nr:hypothetical protein [Brevibacterium sp.]
MHHRKRGNTGDGGNPGADGLFLVDTEFDFRMCGDRIVRSELHLNWMRKVF